MILMRKKTGMLSNKEALVMLKTDLKKVGKKRVTVFGLMKALNLFNIIKDLERDSNLTVLI